MCIKCGAIEIYNKKRGLCKSCYQKLWYKENVKDKTNKVKKVRVITPRLAMSILSKLKIKSDKKTLKLNNILVNRLKEKLFIDLYDISDIIDMSWMLNGDEEKWDSYSSGRQIHKMWNQMLKINKLYEISRNAS